jgi:hypothetical protein
MASHELCIAVKFFGLTSSHCENAELIVGDGETNRTTSSTNMATMEFPAGSGNNYEDFSKIGFQMQMTAGGSNSNRGSSSGTSGSAEEIASLSTAASSSVSESEKMSNASSGNNSSNLTFPLQFQIDRCGGDWNGVKVNGELRKIPECDEEHEKLCKQNPELTSYFILQDLCYTNMLVDFAGRYFGEGKIVYEA